MAGFQVATEELLDHLGNAGCFAIRLVEEVRSILPFRLIWQTQCEKRIRSVRQNLVGVHVGDAVMQL